MTFAREIVSHQAETIPHVILQQIITIWARTSTSLCHAISVIISHLLSFGVAMS